MVKFWLSSIIFTTYLLVATSASLSCDHDDTIRGIFAFGDDTLDPGNNRKLPLYFLNANFLPYGVDFPNGPSGRFSNGKTLLDCIADKLGLPYPPPYPNFYNRGENIIQGVNFASTGTGLFQVTGIGIPGIQHMPEQINRFKNDILPELKHLLNCRGQSILPQYLFVISAGNNDYSSWWILKQYLTMDPHLMSGKLVDHMNNYIKELYQLGARKFLLVSTYPIGCGPGIVKERTRCIQYLNNATDIYHQNLITMVLHAKQMEMPDAEFSILNSGRVILDIYERRCTSGISVVDCACCEVNRGDTCKHGGKACLDRYRYLYFDGYHLTQAANCFLATQALYSNNKLYVTPSNVQKLVNKRIVEKSPNPLAPQQGSPPVHNITGNHT